MLALVLQAVCKAIADTMAVNDIDLADVDIADSGLLWIGSLFAIVYTKFALGLRKNCEFISGCYIHGVSLLRKARADALCSTTSGVLIVSVLGRFIWLFFRI